LPFFAVKTNHQSLIGFLEFLAILTEIDLEFREEKGFFPDLWIPAEDAVNYAVAAVRKGTITTAQL